MSRRPRSTPRSLKLKAAEFTRALIETYPTVRCALDHRNAFELLVATVLSAQCTDERVNRVTPALFARYPGAVDLAVAEVEDVEALIHSTGFFRAKAKNLVALSQKLVEYHGGQVPADLDALTCLPGVGRKTAHVVLGNAFAIPSGVVVDTHVKRLAFRFGLTKKTEPTVIEHELAALLPQDQWIDFSHRLIAHGRSTCLALRPRCDACPLLALCPRVGVKAPAPGRTA
ncbi:endonuclease III [Tundrisphaera sp. TA3]|uniref:endonuclease III n=1 Tax=Tundrisphaera sp. TA3 TaxID=3435775 RepID=UPI003EBFA3C9